jgi:ubiquinol-cytochrome c reductase iron-sulfur subunit
VTEQDPRKMSREQLATLASKESDTEVVAKVPHWPLAGSKREKRAERVVGLWLLLSCLSAAGFVTAFVIWPNNYVGAFEDGHTLYSLYTPVLGLTFGFAVLALGIAVGTYQKRFFPDEVAVQQRHDGPSEEMARQTVVAQYAETADDVGIGRRPFLRRATLAATTLLAGTAGVLAVGPFVRNPWKGGDQAALWVTGWKPLSGEKVYLRTETGVLGDIALARPENMEPGAMQTVYPFRESDRGEADLLLAAKRASDTPVMLIRLRAGTEVTKRPGQEDFNYGDYYAFSKICTHLGCPASEYDSQNTIALCPCHQSEFLIRESAKPIFGPATRPLPQLPITVDEEGYFVAKSDFVEPVGPAFWIYRAGQ